MNQNKTKKMRHIFFNKWLYLQRYYDGFNDVYFWRFWILGFYFDNDKNLPKYRKNKDE